MPDQSERHFLRLRYSAPPHRTRYPDVSDGDGSSDAFTMPEKGRRSFDVCEWRARMCVGDRNSGQQRPLRHAYYGYYLGWGLLSNLCGDGC